jgi:hypothetical protein
MPQAVGITRVKGFPVLAAADAMVKAARVTLVSYVRIALHYQYSRRRFRSEAGHGSDIEAAQEYRWRRGGELKVIIARHS